MVTLDLSPTFTNSEASCCETPIATGLATNVAQQIADELQLLAHPIRLQILTLLSQCEGQICVCDIETSLPVKQPTVSHHLRLLREAGLIVGEKQGHYVYYAVQPEAVRALWNRVQLGMTSIL
jgi:ArsR family transcriptional regulator